MEKSFFAKILYNYPVLFVGGIPAFALARLAIGIAFIAGESKNVSDLSVSICQSYGTVLPKSRHGDKRTNNRSKKMGKGSNSIVLSCLRQILRSLTWQQNKATAPEDA